MADDEDVTPQAGELTTANYGWVKPTVGDSDDAWGGYLNTDLDGIDSTVKSVSNAIPLASSTTPVMDGAAAVGTGATWARADHVHPSDTSRYAASNPSAYQTAAQVTAALPVASSTTPVMDGIAAVGVGTTWARTDHVHPSDTSKLSLTGGTLTGALTPSQTAGLVGTTAANNANAGAVGEFVTANGSGPIGSGTSGTLAQINLTAGDWEVEGTAQCNFTSGGQQFTAAISLTAATLPGTINNGGYAQASTTAQYLYLPILPTGSTRVSIAATTTVYLVVAATFTTGTASVNGAIRARRVR